MLCISEISENYNLHTAATHWRSYRTNYIAFIIIPFIVGKCSATMTYRFDDVSEIREKYNLHTAATHQHSYTMNYIAEIWIFHCIISTIETIQKVQ